jgi:hypothetical protein
MQNLANVYLAEPQASKTVLPVPANVVIARRLRMPCARFDGRRALDIFEKIYTYARHVATKKQALERAREFCARRPLTLFDHR